jgi:hypothetical protein
LEPVDVGRDAPNALFDVADYFVELGRASRAFARGRRRSTARSRWRGVPALRFISIEAVSETERNQPSAIPRGRYPSSRLWVQRPGVERASGRDTETADALKFCAAPQQNKQCTKARRKWTVLPVRSTTSQPSAGKGRIVTVLNEHPPSTDMAEVEKRPRHSEARDLELKCLSG